MTQFCEGCPVAGECQGDIEVVEGANFEHEWLDMGFRLRWQNRLVQIVQSIDEDGKASELMQGVDGETLLERVEDCTGPKEITKPRLFRRTPKITVVCGALGIRPNVLPEYREHYERAKSKPEPDDLFPPDES